MVAGNAMWKVVFQCLLQHVMSAQEAGGYILHMHLAPNSVRFTFQGALMWYVCLGLVAQSMVYVNGCHFRWKPSVAGPQ